MNSYIPDALDDYIKFGDLWFFKDHVYDKTEFLASLQQRFSRGKPEYEMINQDQYWSFSIPHETSGPCYTYDPPHDSDPGYTEGMYLIMNSSDWNPGLQMFLHPKGKFFYHLWSTHDTVKLELSKIKGVKTGHPLIAGKPNKQRYFNQ